MPDYLFCPYTQICGLGKPRILEYFMDVRFKYDKILKTSGKILSSLTKMSPIWTSEKSR